MRKAPKHNKCLGMIDQFAVSEQPPTFLGCSLSALVYIFVIVYVAVTAVGWLNVSARRRKPFFSFRFARSSIRRSLSQAPDDVVVEPNAFQTTASDVVVGCSSACGCSWSARWEAVVSTTKPCQDAPVKSGFIAPGQTASIKFCYSPLASDGIYVKGQIGSFGRKNCHHRSVIGAKTSLVHRRRFSTCRICCARFGRRRTWEGGCLSLSSTTTPTDERRKRQTGSCSCQRRSS